MLDVSEVILDPDFAQEYPIWRRPGAWVGGRWVPGTEYRVRAYGTVTVATTRDLEQVPEGDRVKGMMCFYSDREIFTTREEGTSDEPEWRGERYRIVQVAPWGDFGYWKAIGARMAGD